MERREFIKLIGGVTAAAWPVASHAQSKALPKVGILGPISSSAVAMFLQGMLDLGLIDGESIVVQGGHTGVGQPDQLTALASELVSNKVDVIFASGSQATRAAMEATSTIPIVTIRGDPVGLGFAKSLARPGGNVTGLSILAPQVSGKRLELLKQIVPALERVVVFWNPDDPGSELSLKETEGAAVRLALTLQILEMRRESAFAGAFAAATEEKAQAVALTPSPFLDIGGPKIAELALQSNLPTMGFAVSLPKAGGLIAYGPSIPASFRRAAAYVDKILRGAKPANLPVEQPTIFELAVNLQTARAIGVTIPTSILVRADEVIE